MRLSAKSFVFIAITIFFLAAMYCRPLFAQDTCLLCHESLKESKKYIHKAFTSGCQTCHITIQGMEHPQQKDSIRYKQDLPELCFDCHQEKNFYDIYVHNPTSSGACLSCHDPHQSDHEHLLIKPPTELCFGCHDKSRFTRKYVHQVSLQGCVRRCHNAHASSNQYLLSVPLPSICLTCHASKKTGRHVLSTLPGGKVHPVRGVIDPSNPTKEISCVSCHDPHSSEYPNLAPSPRLCSRCHRGY